MFARAYPNSVAGLVLVDSVHRDQSHRMPAQLRQPYEDGLLRITGVLSSLAPTGLLRLIDQPASIVAARLPASVRSQAVEFSFESKSYRTLAAEMRAFAASEAQVAAAGPLPSVPHVALVSTEVRDFPPGFGTGQKEIWDALQQEQFAANPRDPVRVVAKSGHYIHLDRPEVVVQSILDVVARARLESKSITASASLAAVQPKGAAD
jgi:pimeloyl-ACP methyl ester carboxylesterase